MGKGSAPAAPDPYQSAAAQAQYGEQAALYGAGLNRPNVVTPYGSTTWTVNQPSTTPGTPTTPGGVPAPRGTGGTFSNAGPGFGGFPGGSLPPYLGGGAYGAGGGAGVGLGYTGGGGGLPPQFTETQTLSPEQQALLEQRQGTTLAAGQGAQAGLATPLPTIGQNQDFGAAARSAAYGFDTSTMDPYWKEQERQTDSSLRNAGATPGTPAYDNAMTQFRTQRDQAYAQARDQAFQQGLSAQGQQIQQIGQLRDIPLNEYTALSGGSTGAPGAGGAAASVGGPSAPDIMSAFQNQYQGQLGQYNANVASTNADIGAFGTIAAAILSNPEIFASDERLKKDVKPIQAKTARGNPLYTYRYNFQSKDEPKQVGVIAQEAEKNTPEAVIKDAKGMRYVDYRRA